jgi:hypothetical protein
VSWLDSTTTPRLAETLENNQRGTSLPGSPADGDEYIYVADATLGVVWHFKYRSASASSYKWEFVGGPPMSNEINNAAYPGASEVRAGSSPTYGNLTTTGPSVTLPLAGDYTFDFGAIGNQGGAGDGLMSFAIGAAAATDAESLFMNGAGYGSRTKFVTRNVPSASSAIVCKYRNTDTGATDYRGRWLKITPVRVI